VTETLALRIDALLPQTQCGKCGFDGCLPYAQAIAGGSADINRCPPGGTATIEDLAALLQREPKPLDPRYGREQPPQIAVIDEESCIGCVKCLRACPVDAIIGAPGVMHTVIPQQCTGCELCLPPCPVDCIALVPVAPPAGIEGRRAAAARARARFLARQKRIENQRRHAAATTAHGGETDQAQKRAYIRNAVKRSQARRCRADKTRSDE
jgi:electron transport complex protein RnfB